MSLRPIDMTTAIQRTTEATKTIAQEGRRADVQVFAEQIQKQVRLSEQQVQQSNKSESQNIKRDAQSRREKQRREELDKKRKRAALTEQILGIGGGLLDIRI